jgi:hypothetical protein
MSNSVWHIIRKTRNKSEFIFFVSIKGGINIVYAPFIF